MKDIITGGALINASIYVTTEKMGTTTNSYGYYSLFVKRHDSLGIVVSYQGYQPVVITITGEADQILNYNHQKKSSDLEKVVVNSSKMKEGNKKQFSCEGGIGVISSNLTLQVPIVKNK